MSHVEHHAQAPASVACYVLTVSDSRTPDTDTGGRTIRELLEGAGHQVTCRSQRRLCRFTRGHHSRKGSMVFKKQILGDPLT